MDRIDIMNDITLMLMDADTLTLCAVRNALKAILSAEKNNGQTEGTLDTAYPG